MFSGGASGPWVTITHLTAQGTAHPARAAEPKRLLGMQVASPLSWVLVAAIVFLFGVLPLGAWLFGWGS